MPAPAPEPLAPPLSIWLVNPFDDIPGEGLPPMRYWSLARVLAARGHDVTWWTCTWSHRRKAIRSLPREIREDEGFGVRLVAVRPYEKNVSLARLGSHRDFGKNFERLANESIASGQMDRPDIIVASLPPLESPTAAARLAHRLDATLVIDVQDLWPETFERLVPGPAFFRKLVTPLLLRTMRATRRAALGAADAVSFTTHTYADTLRGEVTPGTPTHVCYLGAYPQEFPAMAPLVNHVPLLGAAGDSPVPLQCVYSGSLEAGQDLEALVGAARRLSAQGTPVTIHVAGTGRLEPLVSRAAQSIGGSCLIEMHGLLGRQEYVKLLASCDGLVGMGFNVVFVAHSTVKRTSPPDLTDGYDRWELKLSKQVSPLLKEWCDALLFVNYETRTVEGTDGRTKALGGRKRVIHTERSAAFDAKNRYGLAPVLDMDIDALAPIFAEPAKRPGWRDRVAAAATVEELGRIGDEADQAVSEGRLTPEQRGQLDTLIDARQTAIEAGTEVQA